MDAVTTSIRMPAAVRDQYETLARATGRTRNDLMVDALRQAAEGRLHELALIQEGVTAWRDGRTLTADDLVAEFAAEGLLSPRFSLADTD